MLAFDAKKTKTILRLVFYASSASTASVDTVCLKKSAWMLMTRSFWASMIVEVVGELSKEFALTEDLPAGPVIEYQRGVYDNPQYEKLSSLIKSRNSAT